MKYSINGGGRNDNTHFIIMDTIKSCRALVVLPAVRNKRNISFGGGLNVLYR